MSEKTYYVRCESPVGELLLSSDGQSLTGVYMTDQRYGAQVTDGWVPGEEIAALRVTRDQLAAYFRGERRGFDLPLSPSGTEFQRKVWDELRRIPYGETISYGELARRVGNAKASRAVGLANGKNPLPIVVPCHRVIGADGSLTGFGGGLDRKRYLLDLEKGATGE